MTPTTYNPKPIFGQTTQSNTHAMQEAGRYMVEDIRTQDRNHILIVVAIALVLCISILVCKVRAMNRRFKAMHPKV